MWQNLRENIEQKKIFKKYISDGLVLVGNGHSMFLKPSMQK